MGQVPDYEVLIRELLAGVAAGWSYDELTSWMTSQNLQEGDLALWLRAHGAVLWLEDENRQQLLTVAGFGKGELARSIAEVSQQWKPALEEWEEWLKKGVEYYYSDLYTEAIPYFEKILAIKQNNYVIWLKQGIALTNLGRHEEALISFNRAIKIKPDLYKAFAMQGYIFLLLGRHEEAVASFDQAIEIKPDYADAWSFKGYVFSKLEKYEESVQSFDRAIKIKPDYADAWHGRGCAFLKLEKYEEAVASFDRVIDLKLDYVDAWHGRGYAFLKLEKYEEAVASFDRVIDLKLDYANAWSFRGYGLLKLEKYEEAVASFDRAIDLKLECSEYAEAFFGKGNSLINLEKYEEAIESFDQLIKIKPDYADAWDSKGFALQKLERWDTALPCHQAAIDIDPKFANAWDNKGVALQKLERWDESLPCHQTAIDIYPKFARAWDNKGVTLSDLGRSDEALDCFQNAIEIDPDFTNAWNGQGFALEELGRSDEALDCFQNAIEIDPDFASAWDNKGVTLGNLGRWNEVLDCFQNAIDIYPKFANAWTNKGVALEKLERIQESLDCHQIAINIDSKFSKAWNNKGVILTSTKQYKEALLCYQCALDINPYFAKAWVNRGDITRIIYDYDAQIYAYYEAFKHIKKYTHPKDYGYIQHQIGRAHYKDGINQLLNKGKSPQIYYDRALTSYHKALETLTREKFPQLRLETLLDLIKVHLAQKDTDAACERQNEAFDIFGDLLNAQPNIKAKKRLKRKYSSLRQFDVDLFIARGDNRRALEAAELNKNEGLMLLLSALDEQTIQPNYDQMRELLTSDSTSKTGIIYWHLSQDNLTTFILTTEDPEPLLWESDSSSENPPQRAYQAQQFQTWLKEWDTQYRNYSTKKWTETDDHSSGAVKKDERKNHPWRKNLSSSLNQLSQILEIDKICDRLPSNLTHLILIPHRDLHRFPLHTLFLATNKLTNLQGCSYLPSIQIGLNLRERNSLSSYAPFLNITDPKTEQPELAFARIESALVRHLHHPHTHFEGKSADLTTIKNALSQHHATFNFTGHAAYDPENPEVSALACAGGLLTAQEIWEFDLSSYNLVNLAACETAITGGKPIFSDEYVGLSSAFLHARAANILGTLWQVDEVATTWFTIYFYQQLLAGTSPAVALTITQQWMQTLTWQNLADWLEELSQLPLDSGIIEELYADRKIVLENEGIIVSGELIELSDPYYWAAFTLTGRG